MELDVNSQTQLMFFIQKIIGEGEDNPVQDTELFRKEMEIMKNEKKKMSKQITELEKELASVTEEKNRLANSFAHLKAENERLYADIDRKSVQEERHSSAFLNELRIRLNDKDAEIEELKKYIEKIKRDHENELAKFKDDLDIANEKAIQIINADKTLKMYKKRLESLTGIKQKAADLQKQNENLMETVASQHNEIEILSKVKKQNNLLKEQMAKEKSRADTLSFNLENKEKLLKKAEKEISESKQKIGLLEGKVKEIMLERQDSSHSEDSFVMNSEKNELNKLEMQSDEKFAVGLQRNYNARKSCMPTAHEQIELALKDLNYQKTLIKAKKMEIKAHKENILMCLEEMDARAYEYQSRIKQLESNNLILSDQIQIMNESLAEKENEKVVHSQILYELDEVKSAKVALLSDIKNLYAEKDTLHKKFMDGREEFFLLQKQIHSKDSEIKELELEVKIFKDKILAFEEKEKFFQQELTSLKRNSVDSSNFRDSLSFERELIALKNENSELQARLNEKIEKISQISREKEENSEKYSKAIEELEEKHKQELEIKTQEAVSQLEEAMNELLKQREQIAAKLQFERRSTMMSWQRAMSIKDPTLLVGEEIFKLREALLEKEKEIARVTKNNKELKMCWKDSAKLLKAVWKQLGDETKKIEEAVKKRHY